MRALLIGKVLLLAIGSPLGFLSSILGIISYIARYEQGRAWLERLEKTGINAANLLGHLEINGTVPELREAIWRWARILFGVTIAVTFLHSELLLTVFALSAVLFSLGALSLQAISQTRSVLKFAFVAPVLYSLVFSSLLIIGLRVDPNVALLLAKFASQCGFAPPSSVTGLLIVVAIFAVTLLVLHAAILTLLALVGAAFVLAIWFVVKVSAFLSRRYNREILNRSTAVVALIFCVIGFLAYIVLWI
jgi:hypothetical protein